MQNFPKISTKVTKKSKTPSKTVKKTKIIVIRGSKVSIPQLRKDLAGLAAGYRKHPRALRGIKSIMKVGEVRSTTRKLDNFEAKEEKLEKELVKVRRLRNVFAAAIKKKATKTKNVAKAVLSKEDGRDFR